MNPFYNPPIEKRVKGIVLLILFLLSSTFTYSQTYNWKPVQIKGGGFISGFIYSKADPSLLFARTDVGGAYRWNQSTKTWTPLTDGMLNSNDWGVWSMAADPTNANNVYMATGLYSESWGQNGSIYKSTDKGTTWTNISNLSIKLGGNNPARGSGERLVVDPNKPSVLFLGSKKDGLYKSTDSGVNWTKVTSLSASYITFVEFDKSTGTTGNATQNIYAGVADNIYNGGNVGVYRSTDGGATWNKLTNHPTQLTPKTFAPGDAALTPVPSDMYITTGNIIYFTYCNTVSPDGDYTLSAPHTTISNGAVYKFDKSTNAWTNITPSGSNGMQGGFSSISVSATNANKIAIATIGRWWPHDEVYFSSDAGANWASTFNSYSYASTWGNSLNKATISTTKAPYAGQSGIGWPSSIEMSPTNDNQVMISSGGGVFACYDVSALFSNATSGNTASTTWIYENDGIEETVPLEIVSPPSGAPLVSAIGDIDGFVHSNLDASPAQGKHGIEGTHTGTTRSIAFAENLPSKMVRAYDNDTYNKGAYSTDGGLTWTKFATKPSGVSANDGSGKIAISTDGNRIVWSSVNATIAYSSNNGSSWTASTGGVPNGLKPVADRVNKNKFYVFDGANQRLYYSTDGAVSFSNTTLTGTTGVPNYEEYQPEACATLANEGHLWLANQNNGLFRSTNGGLAWTKITTVTSAIRVTTGKSVTATGYPAVFIWGVVSGVNGLFRSDDQGATWERLNNTSTEWAHNPTTISGDPRIYGRVYIGLGGRGIIYGDKTTATCTATITTPATSFCTGGSTVLTASTGSTYKWSNAAGLISGATNATYTATAAGSYTVAVTDASGCTATSAATAITVNALPTATITSTATSFCTGGSVVLSANTGTGLTYQWSNTAGTIASATNATYTATAASTYTVKVTNTSNCSATSTGTAITVNALPTATITSTATSFCTGGSVVLSANTGSGLTYQWSNTAGIITNATNATYTATAASTYTVKVTNTSNCSATSTGTAITVNALPTATITSTATSFCTGGSVILSANTGTGLTYQWSNAAGTIASATNANYTASAAGTYTVTVTNTSTTCSATSAPTTITVTASQTATITSTTNSFCTGGSVVLSANTGSGLTYQWSNSAGVIASATNATYTATAASTYTVTVNNGTCSGTSTGKVITVNALPTATITASATSFCTGGSALLSANTGSGLTYQWSNTAGAIASATNATYTATTAGTYTVTVNNGTCSATSTGTTITVNALPTATISSPATSFCTGGSVILSANTGSGLTYQWSNSAGTIASATNISYTATAAGTYTVKVTNSSNCSTTSAPTTITVTASQTATITSSSNSFCTGGSVLLSANTGSGLTYQWSNTAGTIALATNATYTATAASTYTVTVSNGSCTGTSAGKVITVNSLPTATITAPVTSFCTGGSAILSANTGSGLTYQWSNTAGTIASATNATYTATTAGTYSVTVNNGNCSATSTATTITVTALPTATITSSATSFCTGGSVLLSANTGTGLTYQWSNTSGTIAAATNATLTVSAAGTYTVKVTNTNNCSATSTGTTITVTASIIWYQDLDGDGKGDPSVTQSSCTQPTGYVSVAGDACPTDPAKIAAGNCGCGNSETSCLDCAGVPNGGAFLDNCSVCVGGATGNTPCTTTATKNGTSTHISVSPQPFQTSTTIKLENLGTIKSITIVNVSGALVEQKNNINATEISLGESLASGMYSVTIYTENEVYTTKIIKF